VVESFSSQRDRLHEEAAAQVGYDRFGAEDYQEGLTVLLDGMDAGPRLTEVGYAKSLELVRNGLAGRLHSQRGWDLNPDFRGVRITAPVIIMGLPRSGTTALHKLISMDPQFQGFERWLLANPKPRPSLSERAQDPLYQATVEALQARYAAAPEAQKAHPVVADEPDECLMPMSQSFVSNWWGSNLEAPGYDDWFFRQDETASYRRYADNLRLVGLRSPERRWLLKNPSHIMGVEALLRVSPDACLIHTVRHPGETIASLTNLMANIRGPLMGHEVDRAALGRRQVRWYSEAVRRAMAASARHPDRIMEVDFRSFLEQPLAVVRSIYDRFGLEMTAGTEARQQQWVVDNPQGKHGQHRYSLEGAGLTLREIETEFEDYIRRYGLRESAGG